MKMSRSPAIKFYALFMLALLGVCLTPFVNQLTYIRRENETALASTPLDSQGAGDWENSTDPFHLDLNAYYTLPSGRDISYATFSVMARGIYFIYLGSPMFWTSELYNNSDYTLLLGIPYSPPYSMSKYMIFSPNHTGNYYLKLYSDYFSGEIAILTAIPYIVNTSRLLIISPETNPVEVLQVELLEGNYSAPSFTIYTKVDRGWNYVVLPEMYGTFGSELTHLTNGSYSLIIDESCNFRLTGYLPSIRNETPPPPPPPDNGTDTNQGNPILNGITPLFGIGVLVGLCALYKFKKR